MAELIAGVRRGEARDIAAEHRSGDKYRPDRDTPAHERPSRRLTRW
jgi:hypothetical protein